MQRCSTPAGKKAAKVRDKQLFPCCCVVRTSQTLMDRLHSSLSVPGFCLLGKDRPVGSLSQHGATGRFWDPSQLVCSANAKPEEGEDVAVSSHSALSVLLGGLLLNV